MDEIPKAYEPKRVESKWYQFWLDQKCFVAEPGRVSEKRPAYSIVIPPPNVTGVLTLGHVLNNTIQDILARKARMDGKEVLWLPGTDHAGIATEAVVVRTLKKAGEIKYRDDLSREQFLEKVWEWKEKHGGIILQQLKALGASCDWTRTRFTMDPEYSRCVQRVFVDLYKKGLIYRGKRMVNWDPAARTALSDEEVIMQEEKGHLWHVKYPLLDDKGQPLTNQAVIVATTRPETMLGDEAVAVNPNDQRYKDIIGRRCLLPLRNKAIPIIADALVDPKFGTGCVKVTPAHDPADYEMALRHKLPLTVVIGPDGRITAEAGEDFEELDRFEARKAVVEELEEQKFLVKVEEYVHNVGYSERTHVPIEPYLSEQWFLKYPSVEKSHACVAQEAEASIRAPRVAVGAPADSAERSTIPPSSGLGTIATDVPSAVARATRVHLDKMYFYPPRWAKVYDHWMGSIKDWCISRQLWWGHRIPVWDNDEGRQKLSTAVPIIEVPGTEIAGANIKELRAAAWDFAKKHELLNHTFHNDETGWKILVRPASLEDAFTHQGPANIKVVVVLPRIIRTAVKIGSLHHVPANEHFKAVHLFVAAARVDGELYQVKITVKEHTNGQKLYDHQLFKVGTPDGESPAPAAVSSEPTRPTSGAEIQIAALFADVNRETTFTRCQIEEPGPSWGQDPDVLDTWFSSWLWPFATMGWTGDKTQDSNNPTLQAFYPTTDLVTGPDIIFFWVARMIMAGYEYMDEMPFRNVYFTGIIRDKLGRKMSKSLGNSPDPLDLINKYGADALRFGIMRSAPQGQDLLYDEQSVELGRNFCNKLWNACRFRQMVGSADVPVEGEIEPRLLSSDDKWILLKLDTAIGEVSEALNGYKFNEAASTLYRFFWSEFCDWYLETTKTVLTPAVKPLNGETAEPAPASTLQRFNASTGAAARQANTLAVIDFVLANTLRLFHPFLPFITEELWHGMGFNRELPTDQGGNTIMTAHWPKPLGEDFKSHYGLDESDERLAQAKYDLVTQGRNLRRENNIPSGKKIKFVFKPAHSLATHDAEVLKILLNAESLEVDAQYQPARGTPTVLSPLGELYLPLEGLIDVAAEKARLIKELAKIEAEIEKVQAKLNNPNFVQKVPANVLQEHQNRLADWQTQKQQVQAMLDSLG